MAGLSSVSHACCQFHTNTFEASSAEQEGLHQKNEELIQALREKTKKFLQTQELYDKLKRRAMVGQVQNAASDAVDFTLQQGSVLSNRYVDHASNMDQHSRQPPLLPGIQNTSQSRTESSRIPTMQPSNFRPHSSADGWNTYRSNQEGIHHN